MLSVNASRHIPALDGLRGYAALLVVLSHLDKVGLVSHSAPFAGALGVLIFFVLSGFLMGHLYLWKPIDPPAVFHYIVARIARILPLYYITLLVSFALSHLYGQNFIYYIDTYTLLRQMLFFGSAYVFWSIPPEVQFYFVFVGLWWLIATDRLARWTPLVFLIVASILVIRPILPGISVFGQLQIFLTGVIVAALRRYVENIGADKRIVTTVQILVTIAVFLIVTNIWPIQVMLPIAWRSNDTVYGYLPIVLVFGAALLAMSFTTRFSTIVFANRVAAKLGAFSFSLYLLHEPVLDVMHRILEAAGLPWFTQLGLSLVVAVGVAAISYYTIEMPAQAAIKLAAKKIGPRLFAAVSKITSTSK
jgi:peptidoglycan/LPS O-acetylase OafA/YrhL